MGIAKRSIELEIPDAEQFEDAGHDTLMIPVPYGVVTGAIDILQATIATWTMQEGCEKDDETWGDLMAAAGLALGGLVGAYTRKRAERAREGRRLMQEAMIANRAYHEQEEP